MKQQITTNLRAQVCHSRCEAEYGTDSDGSGSRDRRKKFKELASWYFSWSFSFLFFLLMNHALDTVFRS